MEVPTALLKTTLLKTTEWRGRFIGLVLGALAVLGQAPFHFWPLTVICFAALLARLKWASGAERRILAGFSAGFWFGFGYFMAGTYWIGSAFIARGPEFIPIMPPMILALGALLAFFWGLAGAGFTKLRLTGAASLIAFVSFFSLAEFTRGHIFGGFPWNLPGYVFKGGSAISQAASWVGVYGLTTFVFILSSLAYLVVFTRRRTLPVVALALLIGGLFLLGALRLSNAKTDYVEDVKLRIVQVRFDQKDKFDTQKSISIINEFLTQSIAPGVNDRTHIIWPEGAVNGLALDNEALINAMGYALIDVDDTPPIWLLNSLRLEQRPNPINGKVIDDYFNSSAAITFTPDGIPSLTGFSDKRRLVPFGEFIPGGKWMEARDFPVISTSLASISAAPKKINIDFPGLPRVSAQICYEIIFSGFTPHPKTEPRAEWILNQSNDAWYGASMGPLQHANMASYRAIEEGLPVVRAAANGISGVVDPYGRYTAKIGPKITGVVDSNLPKPLSKTLFSSLVNYLLVLINLILGLCCFAVGRSRMN